MFDPVLPGEGPVSDEQSPMSDADLAEVETRLEALAPIPAPWEAWEHEGDTQIGADAGQFVANIGRSSWPNTPIAAELIANAPTDLRRLLDEVQRLRHENEHHKRYRYTAEANAHDAARENRGLRSECAALTAKAETAAADALDSFAETLEHLPPGGEALGYRRGIENAAFLAREEAYRFRPLEPASGIPRPPAEETEPEYRCRECDRWALWTDGELADDNDGVAIFWCQFCSAEMRLDSMDSRPQEPACGPETAGTGSDRGTGGREPHARPETVVWGQGADCPHLPEWHCEHHGECRGCECGCDTINPEVETDPLPSLPSLPEEDRRG